MKSLRTLSILLVPVLGACIAGDQSLPPFTHSPGFFAAFQRMVDDAKPQGSADKQAVVLDTGFRHFATDTPDPHEVYAAGPTWDKVLTFMDIGILSAEIMAPVAESAQNRVDIFADAADRVLRSDYSAITAWNQQARDMGFADQTIQPTAEMVWEALYLVLTESEHTERQVHLQKGNWVDGYFVHKEPTTKVLWVDGYNETVWQEGTCRDEYVGTECTSYWVDESCSDVWIDDGYWDSTCSAYDDQGECIEWTDEWVSTGYYETQCTPAYVQEDCVDVYQTICESGRWVDVWIDGHYVENARIPGDLEWVEGHVVDAAGLVMVARPEQEAAILAKGIEYVASFGPEWVKADCLPSLQSAVATAKTDPVDVSVQASKGAILQCLDPH